MGRACLLQTLGQHSCFKAGDDDDKIAVKTAAHTNSPLVLSVGGRISGFALEKNNINTTELLSPPPKIRAVVNLD